MVPRMPSWGAPVEMVETTNVYTDAVAQEWRGDYHSEAGIFCRGPCAREFGVKCAAAWIAGVTPGLSEIARARLPGLRASLAKAAT